MTMPADSVALLLFQNIRQGMKNGRIADLDTVQTEVDAAIAELNSRRLPEESTSINDFLGRLLQELGSLREKVKEWERQLADFHVQAKVLKEGTTQIVARTEACGLRAEQQKKENVNVPAAVEETKASEFVMPHPPSIAPAPSPIDATGRSAPPQTTVVSSPGGPRTAIIHPPDHPSDRSVIHDQNGDVSTPISRPKSKSKPKPVERQGAVRDLENPGSPKVVYGRGGPKRRGTRTVPPSPAWPDRSQRSSQHAPARGPSDIIARQRQLVTSMPLDQPGRLLPPQYDLINPMSPSPRAGTSSNSSLSSSSQDSKSSLSAKRATTVSASPSTPPRPFEGRGKKRSRSSKDDEGVLVVSETAPEEATLVTDSRNTSVKERIPAERKGSHPLEGPAKRKKLRSSASLEESTTDSEFLSGTQSSLDLAHTI